MGDRLYRNLWIGWFELWSYGGVWDLERGGSAGEDKGLEERMLLDGEACFGKEIGYGQTEF